MTAVCLETSALLAWLLGEAHAPEVTRAIDEAEVVVSSVLTVVEAELALVRAEAMNILNAGDAERVRGLLSRSRQGRTLMEISADVRARACRLFPVEPLALSMPFTWPSPWPNLNWIILAFSSSWLIDGVVDQFYIT